MKCIRCKENEKTGYKYCEPCKKAMKKEKDSLSQKERRNRIKKCSECQVADTRTKYCAECAKVVKLRQNEEYKARAEARAEARSYKPKGETRGRKPKVQDKDFGLKKWMLVRGAISSTGRGDSLTSR